jgi:ABC-type amino acid transport substrate-binding protein
VSTIIKELKSADAFQDTLVLRVAPVGVEFSKKSSQMSLEAKVNQVFASMAADATVKKIFNKWTN